MRDESIESFLTQLAARVPAPGGGATAALHAGQAAALLAMVARYSDGPRYDAVLMGRITAEADGLRDHALRWAEDDAAAFSAVAAAYRMPRDSAQEQADRSAAIAAALAGAAGPPVSVMHAALRLTALAAELAPLCNPSVVTDVGAAAAAARAAAVTSALNIEVNLKGITDPSARASLAATAAQADGIAARTDQVVAAVRARLTS
ncbi:MAG TPA: cyclodeaminase/cyclohydrolase family protein [Streptosporangiaceae bacterium]|nr:cyclodeaminase/cyclohydrolase family protein [Streptosporangiaceae bacterium]